MNLKLFEIHLNLNCNLDARINAKQDTFVYTLKQYKQRLRLARAKSRLLERYYLKLPKQLR